MPDRGTEQTAPTGAFGDEATASAAITSAAGGTGETNDRPTTAAQVATRAGATDHEPPKSDQDLDTSPLGQQFREE
jgi:hypothetical protein